MRKQDIKRYLKDYYIVKNRKTTVNHAFAAALSVADVYDEEKVDQAIRLLGQNPDQDLLCVYCDQPAQTWDHVMAIVKGGKFSGFGHQVNNLLPCCKNCNSQKGNRDWKAFIITKRPEEEATPNIILKVEAYLQNNTAQYNSLLDDIINAEIAKLEEIKEQVFKLLELGDKQAEIIRNMLRQKALH
jgi:hypothetical protein